MKFRYTTNPDQDEPRPGATELLETEIHRVVEEREHEVITVREDDTADQQYAFLAPVEDNAGVEIIEGSENGNARGGGE